MKVNATRVHFDKCTLDKGLVETINEIGYENILQILPLANDCDIFYTIIYKENVVKDLDEEEIDYLATRLWM